MWSVLFKVTHQTNSKTRIKPVPVSQSSTLLIAPQCLWKLIWSNIFNLRMQIALKPNCDSLKGSLVRIKPLDKGNGGHVVIPKARLTFFLFIIIYHPLTRGCFEYSRQPLQPTLHGTRGGKRLFLFPSCLFSYEIVVPGSFLAAWVTQFHWVTRKSPLPDGSIRDIVPCCCGLIHYGELGKFSEEERLNHQRQPYEEVIQQKIFHKCWVWLIGHDCSAKLLVRNISY